MWADRSRNITIFHESMELCKTNPLLAETIEQSIARQRFYPGSDPVSCLSKDRFDADAIYTPNVLVYRSDSNGELLPESDWFPVNVISCAAPSLREQPSNAYNPCEGDIPASISDADLLALHEARLTRILDIAASQQLEVIVLGAFGCGAFQNPPEIVAQAAANVIPRYAHSFQAIEFAIKCGQRESANYRIFKSMI